MRNLDRSPYTGPRIDEWLSEGVKLYDIEGPTSRDPETTIVGDRATGAHASTNGRRNGRDPVRSRCTRRARNGSTTTRVVLALVGLSLVLGSLVVANGAGVFGLLAAVPFVAFGAFLIASALRTRRADMWLARPAPAGRPRRGAASVAGGGRTG